eukprot:scaffold19173_cov55-Cyclotella_meneghiniana.AAC.4
MEAKEEERRRLEAEESARMEAMENERKRLEAEEAARVEALWLEEQKLLAEAKAQAEEEARRKAYEEKEKMRLQEELEASTQIANQLSNFQEFTADDEMDDVLKIEMGDLSRDEEELLGKAAREAVRKYEEEMRRKKRVKDAISDQFEEDSLDDEIDFDDIDMVDEEQQKDAIDYTQLTVAELKDALRSKGLKVSGKKSELIERLQNSDQ